jgi:hypothetical protein
MHAQVFSSTHAHSGFSSSSSSKMVLRTTGRAAGEGAVGTGAETAALTGASFFLPPKRASSSSSSAASSWVATGLGGANNGVAPFLVSKSALSSSSSSSSKRLARTGGRAAGAFVSGWLAAALALWYDSHPKNFSTVGVVHSLLRAKARKKSSRPLRSSFSLTRRGGSGSEMSAYSALSAAANEAISLTVLLAPNYPLYQRE